jgi:hypothetical protein
VILVYTGQPVENNTAYARYSRNILGDLEQQLAAYNTFNRARPGCRQYLKKIWGRFTWDQLVVEELKSRINNHIIFLTCFNNTLLGLKIARLQQFPADKEYQKILQ